MGPIGSEKFKNDCQVAMFHLLSRFVPGTQTDSGLGSREEKLERTPGADPPVEFVVLADLGLGPFVVAQTCLFQLCLYHWPSVRVVTEILAVLPADAAEFIPDGVRMATSVVIAREIDGAAVDVDANGLGLALVGH